MNDTRLSNDTDASNASVGLSNVVHISKKADDFECNAGGKGEQEHKVFVRNIKQFFTCESYDGGSLVKISRDNNNWERTTHIDRSDVSKRGKISCFSKASRRRMLQILSKLNKSKIPDDKILFITLSAPGTDSNWQDVSGEQWKKRLNNFLIQLRQKHLEKMQFGMWRMEFQARGAIHFHLVLWNVKYLDKDWVAKCWNRICCKDLDQEVARKHLSASTQVEPARGWGKTQEYFSKIMAYLAKEETESESVLIAIKQFGRHWGIIARSEMTEFIEGVIEKLDYRQYYACRRMILNYLQACRRRTWGDKFRKDAWRVLRSRLLTSDKKNYMLFLDYEHWQRYLAFLLKKSDLDSIHYKINRHFRQLEHGLLWILKMNQQI